VAGARRSGSSGLGRRQRHGARQVDNGFAIGNLPLVPTHSEQFLALMSKHYPAWREASEELNELCWRSARGMIK
jgi:hypothetical protein